MFQELFDIVRLAPILIFTRWLLQFTGVTTTATIRRLIRSEEERENCITFSTVYRIIHYKNNISISLYRHLKLCRARVTFHKTS